MQTENPNPAVLAAPRNLKREQPTGPQDEHAAEEIDELEIYELIKDINDPEHPLSLEQLNVVRPDLISLSLLDNRILVKFVPTIPHCSMATLIGLSIRTRLLRALPRRFRVKVKIEPGTHASEAAINKQLNDKERVLAAMENPHLIKAVDTCLERCCVA